MILIVDNDWHYSAHAIMFVEVPDDMDDAAIKRLLPGPSKDDYALPYVIGKASKIEWWGGKAVRLSYALGIDAFIGSGMTGFHAKPIPDNPRWRVPPSTPDRLKSGDWVAWIRPDGPRGPDDLIRSISEGWEHVNEQKIMYFWEAFKEGAFR